MVDLKQRLERLDEREMPDRWEAIQRRHVDPMPDPRRSRTGAYVASAAVALLAVAVIAWLAPLGADDPKASTLPDAPRTFAAADGWRIAVAPSWHAQESPIEWQGEQVQEVVIANVPPTTLTFAHAPMPVVADPRFPADGVALVVTAIPPRILGFPPQSPPLSIDDFETSGAADGSTIGMAVMQGPEQRYAVSVRIGPEASPADRAALDAALGSITFA